MRFIVLALALFCVVMLAGCTHTRVKFYHDLINPLVGSATKEKMNSLLGSPTWCKQETSFEQCEYRTSRGRSEPVPAIHRQHESMGPDLSPYDYFDVLHLFYDDTKTLREWSPIVIQQ
ncbi:MAG: hypothetical protein HY537_04670 [Deltaproteobacteria bacterium]|nr:hypothetical protein [Deltaproteobacteria bacterium]